MAITQGVCTSFLSELFTGVHDFSADTFKVALYGSSASLGRSTTAYTATGEISGTGYTAAGATVAVAAGYPTTSGTQVLVDWDDVTWASSTLTGVMGALIYNSSKANRAVAVYSFGAGVNSQSGAFDIAWPDPSISPALRLNAG